MSNRPNILKAEQITNADRCPRCDDSACDVIAATRATEGLARWGSTHEENERWGRLGVATRDCHARPAVDWRSRALAAEEIANAVIDEYEALGSGASLNGIKVHRESGNRWLVDVLDERLARSTSQDDRSGGRRR